MATVFLKVSTKCSADSRCLDGLREGLGKGGRTPGWVEKTAQTFRADEILKILSARGFFSAAAALSEFLFPGPREITPPHASP